MSINYKIYEVMYENIYISNGNLWHINAITAI